MLKYFRLLDVKTFGAIIGSLLLGLVGFYFFVYIPRVNTIKILKKELRQSYAKLNETQAKVNALPDPKKKIAGLKEKEKELLKKVTTLEETPVVIKDMVQKIKGHSIDIISIEPREEESKPVRKGEVKKAYIELKLLGNFKDFGKFMEELEGNNPVFTVEELALNASEKQPGKIIIDVVLARYILIK